MKKIFNAILSVAAALLMFSACTDEDVNLGSRVALSQTEDLQIPATGATDFTFNVESDGDWVVVVPAWIKASPRHGTGNDAITLSFEDNYSYVKADNGDVSWEMGGARHASVSVECASGAVGFVVRQEGDPDKPSDEILAISIAEFLAKPDGAQIYQVEGTVTKVANYTYGNLYLNDGTGELYIYGTLDRDGNAKNFASLGIGPGDYLVVQGCKTTYNGTTVEIVNAQYISHTKSLVSLGEAEHKVGAEGGEFSVSASYKGDISVISDAQWLAFTGISSDANGTYLNFTATANTDAARTANVTVTAVSDGTTASQVLKVTQAAGGSSTGGTVFTKVTKVTSGKQYLIVSGGKAASPLAADKNYGYLPEADVTESNGTINGADVSLAFTIESTTGGYTIKQPDGRLLYQSGTYNSFNVNAAPTEGQVWTITANADGTFKIVNVSVNKYIQYSSGFKSYGSYPDEQGAMPALYELTGSGSGSGGGSNPGGGGGSTGDVKVVTVAEFNAAEESQTQVYELVGTIGGTINTKYGNFDLTDETGTVYVYGLTATNLGYGATNDQSYASLGLNAGDKVKIRGYRGSFNSKIEVMYSYFVSKQ